jgi:hypothetical protein
MTAWEIRYYILACDHYDQPDKTTLGFETTLGFDQPRRCTALFRGEGGEPRAAVRKRAASGRRPWVHVRRKGCPYGADPEYCPAHAAEGRAAQEKEDRE